MSNVAVVDASVWISWLRPSEQYHSSSNTWMKRYIAAGNHFVVPSLLLIEVAASIARLTGKSDRAKEAIESLNLLDALKVVQMDAALIQTAIDVAAELKLRAGDAIYVALAHQMGIPLVSWDKEQILKASQIITTYTPENFSFRDAEGT